MNMIDIQDKLKNLSEDQLVREMQSPSGAAPQFLVLSEITRRKRMRDSLNSAEGMNQPTVAEEAVAASGVPQGGIASMAQALAPQSSIAQNTGFSAQPMMPSEPVQGMYSGGPVRKMQEGGAMSYPASSISFLRDPAIQAMAARMGTTPAQLWRTWSEQQRSNYDARQPAMSPSAVQELFPVEQELPTQEDLDRSYMEDAFSFRSSRPLPQPTMDSLPQALTAPMPPMAPSRPSSPQAPTMVDLDLTADAMPSIESAPPPVAAMRMMGLEPSGQPNSNLTNEVLDMLEYGFTPGSDRALTADEVLSQSAGESVDIPPMPEGVGAATTAFPDTRLGIDPYTGQFGQYPTLRTQIASAGEAIAGIPGLVRENLPAFDFKAGDPYSELSSQEVQDILTEKISPEAAAGIQQGRLAMGRFGRGVTAPAEDRPEADQTGGVETQTEQTGNADTGAGGSDTVTGGARETVDGGVRSGVSAALGGTGAAPMSSYEQELANAMQRAERRAEQDKWLALAQVGLGLMSSKEPTIGGALGEAGIAGLEAFRSARNTGEEERLALSKAMYDMQSSREQAAASQRAAAARTRSPSSMISELTGLRDALYETVVNDLGEEVTQIRPGSEGAVRQINSEIDRIIASRIAPQI